MTGWTRHIAVSVVTLMLVLSSGRCLGQSRQKAGQRQWHQLSGIGGYGGSALAVGMYKSYRTKSDDWSATYALFGWGFRGGLLVGRAEFGADMSFWIGGMGGPEFGLMAVGGYYIPLYQRPGTLLNVYLPVRGGIGFEGTDRTRFVARMDPFGLALQISRWMLELNVSVRYLSTFEQRHNILRTLMFNLSYLI